MKVVCFGLRYSPNLGDGVIAECLDWGLRQHVPGADVVLVDLSGRDGFVGRESALRKIYLALEGVLPGPVRAWIVKTLMGRKLDRQAEVWTRAVSGAGLVSIGGGQIFSDADLNFPTKINRIAETAIAAGVPVAVYAVGVARNWSAEGTRLFGRLAAADLRRVGTRDDFSAEAWRDQMPGGPAPVLARDPGLLAQRCYGDPPEDADLAGRIGLCVTDPALLAHHADQAVAGSGAGGVLGFFEDLTSELTGRGQKVCLFTNGAFEDRAALATLAARPAMAGLVASGQVRVAPDPVRPAELAHLIGGLKGLIAHRLHATIVGYAYKRPVIGLSWDRKLESFFQSAGLSGNFFGTERQTAAEICDRLETAMAAPWDDAIHDRITGEALDGIGALLAAADPAGA